MSKTELKTAYLREYPANCDIRFPLNVKTKNGKTVEKDITGFCKNTETLADLKKSIVLFILALVENNKENKLGENCEDDLCDLPSDVVVKFLKSDTEYRDSIKVEDFIKLKEDKILQVINQKFGIVINAPLIRAVKLPFSISAKFPVEPIVFKSHNLDKSCSKFIWYRSKDQKVWQKVAEGYSYDVTEEDVDHYLKFYCLPYNKHKIKGPAAESVSEFKVDIVSRFPECPFQKRHNLTKESLKGNKLRVVSYNVLADRYVDLEQFDYCPPQNLGINYRKQLIMRELEGYNADIICLQEVDEPQYKSFYRKRFNNNGYKSFFHRKGNCIPEGLLCAYRTNRFNVLDSKHLVLKKLVDRKQYAEIMDLLKANSNVGEEFYRQNTSLQVTVLQDKTTKKVAIVANTHLFYHPDADHIRLIQACMATLFLGSIKNRIMTDYKTQNVGIIFCGDFNSDISKSLYDFMRAGTIDPQHKDCLKISPTGDAIISHKLLLISASGTPKYTNYTKDYKGCLDYIFVDSLKFSVIRQIAVPTPEELKEYVGLPADVYPSDHLSLVVDIEFKSR